jgi:superfamily II DNA or RNA helicase
VRDEIRSIMESNDNVVCIAISKIFSTSVNIRNLHYVVFSSIGKAKNKIIQSIGRSLRLHASKSSAYIIDIADNLKYSNKHLQERLELYKEENIVYSVKDVYSP